MWIEVFSKVEKLIVYNEVSQYKEGHKVNSSAIVLKTVGDIEKYMVNVDCNYFSNTNKMTVKLEFSTLRL